MKRRLGIVLTVIMILAIFNLISCSTPDNETEKDNMTSEANRFTARDVFSGKTVAFPDEWIGKIVYLNFYISS